VRYLSDDEIARLLNACAGAFRDLVHAALLTGCRYGELCRLKVADYKAAIGTVTVRLGKSGKARHVTLSDEGPELFDRLIAGRSSTDAILKRDDGRPWRSEQIRLMRRPARRRASCQRSVSMCCGTLMRRYWRCARCRWR
jgi:integrase